MSIVENLLNNSDKITIVTIPGCRGCDKVKNLFKELGIWGECRLLKLNEIEDQSYELVVSKLENLTGTRKCPMIFFGNEFIGDYVKIDNMHVVGTLRDCLLKKLNIHITEEKTDF